MNICNKPPNKTAPENLGEAVPELQVQRARKNGWSWPLHIFQMLAWLLYLFFALVGFGILVPLLPLHWLPAGSSPAPLSSPSLPLSKCPGVCFIYHLIVHLTAVSIDPADANVREKNYLGPLATFSRSQHAHVIENHHCHVCDVNVSAKSKHCGTCNKCVCGFDHHCKWLNNCVGERNYWLFLNSVLSAILGLAPLLLVACYILVQFFLDPAALRSDRHFQALKNHTDCWLVFLPAVPLETQASAILVTAGIFILLSLMTVILLGHLLAFHIYLMWNKLTTYEYILQQRPQQEAKETDKQQDSCPSQVSPSQVLLLLPLHSSKTAWLVHSVAEGCLLWISCSFSKLCVHNDEADLEQSFSPEPPSLHFVVPSQVSRRLSAGNVPGWKVFLLLSFPAVEFPATAAATSSSSTHSHWLSVPALPQGPAVPPSSTGLIQAAGPPADYHSESAESMDEIPVAQTRLGSTALPRPPKNNSSNSQHPPLGAANPRGDRKKNLYSRHKGRRKSCQQDRRGERDLELFTKVPAVFVSKSSGEPHVSQPASEP
ncbi:ZDHC1 palmitoyltransferase, partial [Hemiprocne comata]|nr:ZDHC1 palmitoyltransferase [Hemiprocne comata]